MAEEIKELEDLSPEMVHWHKVSGTFSIVAHAQEELAKEAINGLRLMIAGDMSSYDARMMELISRNYPSKKEDYRLLNRVAVMAYETMRCAPSPAVFFERYDCEHFKSQ